MFGQKLRRIFLDLYEDYKSKITCKVRTEIHAKDARLKTHVSDDDELKKSDTVCIYTLPKNKSKVRSSGRKFYKFYGQKKKIFFAAK